MAVTINSAITPTPAAPLAASDYTYITSQDLAEGALKPEVDTEYIHRYGRQDMTGLVANVMGGGMHGIDALEFHHYEQGRLHGIVQFSASGAAASGGDASYTVGSPYDYSYGGEPDKNNPYLATTANANLPINTIALQEFDVVYHPADVEGLVVATSGTTVEIKWLGSTPTFDANDQISITGTAFPEGSSSPKSRNSRQISYTNTMQRLRRKHKVTNDANGVRTWVEYDAAGNGYGFYAAQGVADEYIRFRNECELQLITGQGMTTAAANVAGFETVIKTEGITTQIESNGILLEFATAGGITFADFEDYVEAANRERANRENMIIASQRLSMDIDLALERLRSADDAMRVNYGNFNGTAAKELGFVVDNFNIGNYVFRKTVYDGFSDPTLLGTAQSKYNQYAIVAPIGNTVTYTNVNGTSSETVPTMRVNYLNSEGGVYNEWLHGYNPVTGLATSGDDFSEVELKSVSGLEMFGLNRFGVMKSA